MIQGWIATDEHSTVHIGGCDEKEALTQLKFYSIIGN